MDPNKLQDILAAHKRWLINEQDGARANLSGAYLSGANLSEANLIDANLGFAYLIDADLSGANLRGASLRGANLRGANLRGANLSFANLIDASLRGANLRGASLRGANLRGANLTNARGMSIADDAPQRLQAVAQAALASDCALEMGEWHTCETTHCIAGWAIHQAGALGRLLEQMHGQGLAGLMLLGPEAHRYFYASNDKARVFLRSVLND